MTCFVCGMTQAASSVEYILRTHSFVEMSTWLGVIQQCIAADTVNTDSAESQPTELSVIFILFSF